MIGPNVQNLSARWKMQEGKLLQYTRENLQQRQQQQPKQPQQ